ncbi:hypothetical protein QEN19_002190 [Hanseniaspora menglaensis]
MSSMSSATQGTSDKNDDTASSRRLSWTSIGSNAASAPIVDSADILNAENIAKKFQDDFDLSITAEDFIEGKGHNETISRKEIDDSTTTKTDNSTNTNDGDASEKSSNHLNSVKRATLINPDAINLDERLGFNHRNKKIKNKPIRGVLKNKITAANGTSGDDDIIVSSPLLTSTPNSISRALIRLYPYLIVCDKILSLLTWTNDDIWASVFMVLAYIAICLYYKLVVTYLGHLLCVLLLFVYSQLDKLVGEQMEAYPTLDDIVYTVSSVSSKFDLLFSPVTVLNNNDLRRLLITTVFLSPLYIVITIFFLPKEKLVLTLGVIALSYHSRYSNLARHLLWRFKIIRLISFYVTGLDIDGIKGIKRASSYYASSTSLFATVHKKLLKNKKNGLDNEANLVNDMLQNDKPIRFTYVLFENQRRWLGKGWTNTLFAYERAAWTDEFYNEAPDPESFKLPITANEDLNNDSTGNSANHSSMIWRWVDKGWRLDLSNDNTIDLPKTMLTTVANPKSGEGWVYYDNTWKKPSVEDTYSKYTRRRRWIRTAELIRLAPASTKVEALKIKKGTVATPDLTDVTVKVPSNFERTDYNFDDHVNAKTSGMSVAIETSSESSSREGSEIDNAGGSGVENNMNLKNRKVSFSGTAEVRTFDQHGSFKFQKRNSMISNNQSSIHEESEFESQPSNTNKQVSKEDKL